MVIEKLKRISALDFENLVYDLCFRLAFSNVRWRSPGADGGRDIEADYIYTDPIGNKIIQKWYIECKRYKTTIDWPTIYSKLSYAHVDCADELLIITTAKLTPTCQSKISAWNLNNSKPKIKHLAAHELENKTKEYPELLVKYGLVQSQPSLQQSFYGLSLIASKYLNSAFTSASFGNNSLPNLETANTISEFLSFMILKFDRSIHAKTALSFSESDSFEWIKTEGQFKANHLNKYGVRALASIARIASRSTSASLAFQSNGEMCIDFSTEIPNSPTLKQDLQEVAFWSNIKLIISKSRLELESR